MPWRKGSKYEKTEINSSLPDSSADTLGVCELREINE